MATSLVATLQLLHLVKNAPLFCKIRQEQSANIYGHNWRARLFTEKENKHRLNDLRRGTKGFS